MSKDARNKLDEIAAAAARPRAQVNPEAYQVVLPPLGEATAQISILGGNSPDGTGWVRIIHQTPFGLSLLDMIAEDDSGTRMADLIADGIKEAAASATSGIVQAEPRRGVSPLIRP